MKPTSAPSETDSPAADTHPADTTAKDTPKKKPRWRRWLKRGVQGLLGLFLLYVVLIVIGLLPTNLNFTETPDGVEIFIISNGVHADIVMPMKHELCDWSTWFPGEHFEGEVEGATHVAVGWGDKGFYLHTPTWNDLKLSTALKALFTPSPCCLHVLMCREPTPSESTRAVRISEDQYARMIGMIQTNLKTASEQATWIAGSGYSRYDTFYEATGNYHLFNTCNSWVGWVMRETGLKTPLWTPLPKSMFLYLPRPE